MSETRETILDKAKECVLRDRQSTYGDLEDNFGIIAQYWSTHMGYTVSSVDVSIMLALVKVARMKTSEDHADNWIDLAGYAACGGEIATNTPKLEVGEVWRGITTLEAIGEKLREE
mgnify:CR=1 FL=1